MKGAAFGKIGGFGVKGMAAKGGFLKGIFGFIGGIFKLFFFGIFLIVFLIIGLVLYFSMRKKMQNFQNGNYNNFRDNYNKKDDDIIDVEIIEEKPIKR
ncbi:hypothetical protein [Caminibacter sp.]